MLKHWQRLTREIVHQNPWWNYQKDRFQIPSGPQGDYYSVNTLGSSLIVAWTAEEKIVLVNQYRYLNDRESWEIPGGGMKPGQTYLETAQAELEEESGYRASHWELLGEFNPCNGLTNEICQVFLASDLELHPPRPDGNEELEVQTFTLAEVEQMIRQRIIWDGMTLAALMIARERLPFGSR